MGRLSRWVFPGAVMVCLALVSCNPATTPTAPTVSVVPTSTPMGPGPTGPTFTPPVPLVLTPPVSTKPSATPATVLCGIRSTAGNCYRAGQFCRQGDLGKTTTDAVGATITCGIESGRPHWHH